MPFTMPDFRKLSMEEVAPWHNALQTAMSNMIKMNQVQYDEPMRKEALEKQRLYNQYYGPEKESEIGLRGAQTGHIGEQTRGLHISNQSLPEKLRLELEAKRFENENPLMNKSGPAGQIGALMFLKQHPELLERMQQQGQMPNQPQEQAPAMESGQSYMPSIMGQQQQAPRPQMQDMQFNPIELLQKSIEESFKPKETALTPYAKAVREAEDAKARYGVDSDQYKKAFEYANRVATGATAYQQKRADAYAWATAPAEAKSYMLAQAAGMGINPDKAINEFSKGKTIEDMAVKLGFDPENLPEPDFLPNKGNITKLKERQAALKELDVLSEFTTKHLKPYSKTIAGYSPIQIIEAIGNKNKDKQANFLAARALAQEANLVRLTVANARGTIPAIRGITQKSLSDIKAFRALVDEDVWEKTQKIIDSKLKEALTASAKAYSLQRQKSKISEELEKKSEKNIDYTKLSDEELLRMAQ